MKQQITSLNDSRVRKSILSQHYDLDAKKIDLATKLDKLMIKILNKAQLQIFNEKMRNTIFSKNDESGLFSLNESDILKGNEIGKPIYIFNSNRFRR